MSARRMPDPLEAAYADLLASGDTAWDVAVRHGIALEDLQGRCGEEPGGHDMQAHDSGDGVYYTYHGIWCDRCGVDPDYQGPN